MTAADRAPAPAPTAEEQTVIDRFEETVAAPESWFPYAASEGDFGPQQIHHRARGGHGDDRFTTACGKDFGGPDWAEWGVGGPFDGDEWPVINCPACPQPVRPCADALAAVERVRALADELDTWGGYHGPALSYAADRIRAALAAPLGQHDDGEEGDRG